MDRWETTATDVRSAAEVDQGLRSYMNGVYTLMMIAMSISGAVAWIFGSDLEAMTKGEPTRFFPPEFLEAMYGGIMRLVIVLAPLVMMFAYGAAMRRLSNSTAQLYLWIFSALMGLSLATIFVTYTDMAIVQTFFATAIAFGGLSLFGYLTRRDLSGWGSFLMMGLFGLIGAMLVNLFVGSDALRFAISVAGVLVFAGLTAYDTQKIKQGYLDLRRMGPEGEAMMGKSAISGALELYLDFLNLFVSLLRIFGGRQ